MSVARTVELFSKIPDGKSFQAGEIIFSEGDSGTEMYGIIEGTVAMQVNGKTVETINAGDVFGEGALVHSDKLRRSTALAQTACQLAVLDEERFKFLITNTPMFAIEVMRSYSDRLRRFKHPEIN
ncbi:Crp/Fnr family transcriptional regulator [Leptolyngbya iicbica]|uniref:Cyclic nucleotide-binding domain-containing protein n=2 Tax=Cyanophyceae TaxID=3028117 RepID=A0A4Q7EL00_9CYAN|nr:cyclic nucleotide-binding domain-containing protein [Leptolyngbya sp. LK]RZM82489.1 cyclic nucleotide-binding domain-containing protein [Leptolyngbya sp. LK]